MARRAFLKGVGSAAAAAMTGAGRNAAGQVPITRIALVVDPSDVVAASPPVRWALDQLRQSFASRKVECRQYARLGETDRSDFTVLAGGRVSLAVRSVDLPELPGPAAAPLSWPASPAARQLAGCSGGASSAGWCPCGPAR